MATSPLPLVPLSPIFPRFCVPRLGEAVKVRGGRVTSFQFDGARASESGCVVRRFMVRVCMDSGCDVCTFLERSEYK